MRPKKAQGGIVAHHEVDTPEVDEEEEEVTVESKKLAGPVGIFLMVLFWVLFINFGYTHLSILWLGITLIFLFSVAFAKWHRRMGEADEITRPEALKETFCENNWVFRSILVLALIVSVPVVISWVWNLITIARMSPEDTITALGSAAIDKAAEAIGGQKTPNPWANEGLKHSLTNGDAWGTVAVALWMWAIGALLVSYWDEARDFVFGDWTKTKEKIKEAKKNVKGKPGFFGYFHKDIAFLVIKEVFIEFPLNMGWKLLRLVAHFFPFHI